MDNEKKELILMKELIKELKQADNLEEELEIEKKMSKQEKRLGYREYNKLINLT